MTPEGLNLDRADAFWTATLDHPDLFAVVQLADGADVWLLRVTDAITVYRSGRRKGTVREQIDG